ncbi:MAG: acetate--CoA ligase family protein [Candidatus Nanoarchaeia archaeon]|nr:acetate--CoA ligase family protein [Candidatus Nanoarchaeia archaeon]
MEKLDWLSSEKLLKNYGVPVVKTIKINLKDDLKKINKFPVVMKVDSENIVHKTEQHAVILDIDSKEELEYAYEKLAKFEAPLVVQEQIKGAEILLGIKEDATFGKVIVAGIGGIYAEALKKISMRVVPLSVKDAKEIVMESELKNILTSRGADYDFDFVETLILKISKMAQKENIKEMDINPFILTKKKGYAVDVRIFV